MSAMKWLLSVICWSTLTNWSFCKTLDGVTPGAIVAQVAVRRHRIERIDGGGDSAEPGRRNLVAREGQACGWIVNNFRLVREVCPYALVRSEP